MDIFGKFATGWDFDAIIRRMIFAFFRMKKIVWSGKCLIFDETNFVQVKENALDFRNRTMEHLHVSRFISFINLALYGVQSYIDKLVELGSKAVHGSHKCHNGVCMKFDSDSFGDVHLWLGEGKATHREKGGHQKRQNYIYQSSIMALFVEL
jgi:hypothetical protein